LKPQLHKKSTCLRRFQNVYFSLVRAGGLCLSRREFHSPGLKLTPMDIIVLFPVVYSTKNRYKSPSNKDEVFSTFILHPSAFKNALSG
jgi:hypothetical protein